MTEVKAVGRSEAGEDSAASEDIGLLKSKIEKYLARGKDIFEGIKKAEDLSEKDFDRAARILDSALRYYSDALHFYEKGEYLNALIALEYAEGWADAGKEIGLLA